MASTFKSFPTPGIGTTETDVYAPIGVTGVVVGFSLANTTTSEITVSARLQKPGPVLAYIVRNAKIPPGESMPLAGGDQKIVVETASKLRVVSDTPGSVDVIISVLEQS
jgi:hypothetical protein